MTSTRFILALLFVVCLLTPSCSKVNPISAQESQERSSSPTPTPTYTISPDEPPLNPNEATPTAVEGVNERDPSVTATATVTENDPISSGRAQYELAVGFNYAQHHLDISESIFYTNTTGEGLDSLCLVVESNRYTGAFHLASISEKDRGKLENYELAGNLLSIPLAPPLSPSEGINLSIEYAIELPEIPPPSNTTRPIPFGYTQRQSNLVDWYPYLPPYLPGKGWQVHDPWYYGEHQVYDMGDYQVNIHLLGANAEQLVIAASGPAKQEGTWLRYEMDNLRTFAWSVSPDYQVFSQTVGSVTVLSYAFPFTLPAGEAALEDTAKALVAYSQFFAPYTHTTLSVVEADFLDGMEYDGLFFLSRGFYNLYDGTPQGYLTAIAVHETAHQWWYGQVGNDQAIEPWLDEALCTYSELLYYEKFYPKLVDWWWGFRVKFYAPSGGINGSIYDYGGFRPYVNAVYLRGALFFADLRQLIGDEAFFSFLQDYVTQKAGGQATGQDFLTILEKHTPKDITPLLITYFTIPSSE